MQTKLYVGHTGSDPLDPGAWEEPGEVYDLVIEPVYDLAAALERVRERQVSLSLYLADEENKLKGRYAREDSGIPRPDTLQVPGRRPVRCNPRNKARDKCRRKKR